MRQSLSIGRIFGIDVRIHATWLLAFAFVTWGLANGYFRFITPRQGLVLPLELGAISALLLFASVLVHEFSHSLVAQALGMRVRNITLFIFGGVSDIGGQAFGFLMIGLGVTRVVLGDLFGGLWTIFIGWFLLQAAGASRQDHELRDVLKGVPVGSVMDAAVPLVDRSLSVQHLVDDYLLRSDRRRLIAAHDGVVVGIIDAGAIHRLPRETWSSTPVSTIAAPISFVVHPDDDAAELLSRLGDRTDLLPVVAEGRVVGAVDLWRLMRFAQLRRDLQA